MAVSCEHMYIRMISEYTIVQLFVRRYLLNQSNSSNNLSL